MIRSLVALLLFCASAHADAALRCEDVRPGSDSSLEKMELLHAEARLRGDYFNRYHESAVDLLCKGQPASAIELADNGYLLLSEVISISEALGLEWRSDSGQSFGYSKERFVQMGLGLAPADNVARFYVEKPDSQCGRLAKRAIEGNPRAVEILLSQPPYCIWQY